MGPLEINSELPQLNPEHIIIWIIEFRRAVFFFKEFLIKICLYRHGLKYTAKYNRNQFLSHYEYHIIDIWHWISHNGFEKILINIQVNP